MHLCQSNPILDIEESLLSEEEPVSMATGEDEEGAISEISNTDVLEDTHPKLKVSVELEITPISPLPPSTHLALGEAVVVSATGPFPGLLQYCGVPFRGQHAP